MLSRWIVILLSFLILAACANPDAVEEKKDSPAGSAKPTVTCGGASQLCFKLTWETAVTAPNASFKLELSRRGDPMLLGGEPAVKLWQPALNHAGPAVQLEKLSTGNYRATHVIFDQPGDWQIWIQIEAGGVVTDQVIQPLTI